MEKRFTEAQIVEFLREADTWLGAHPRQQEATLAGVAAIVADEL